MLITIVCKPLAPIYTAEVQRIVLWTQSRTANSHGNCLTGAQDWCHVTGTTPVFVVHVNACLCTTCPQLVLAGCPVARLTQVCLQWERSTNWCVVKLEDKTNYIVFFLLLFKDLHALKVSLVLSFLIIICSKLCATHRCLCWRKLHCTVALLWKWSVAQKHQYSFNNNNKARKSVDPRQQRSLSLDRLIDATYDYHFSFPSRTASTAGERMYVRHSPGSPGFHSPVKMTHHRERRAYTYNNLRSITDSKSKWNGKFGIFQWRS